MLGESLRILSWLAAVYRELLVRCSSVKKIRIKQLKINEYHYTSTQYTIHVSSCIPT